ncbi:MAG: UDP-N-acetylmuramoyl-tripeptide--D-alanyl-D-alanine ligase [Terrimonas sp.]|nr:UDP-N-acetylmuramoyl-tripeptide--D-alanyl-D-alanine ligase [Terrimonas sp.]
MDIAKLYEIYRKFPSVQTDTRLLQPSDLFFALKGENFNGNHFAAMAIEKGAAYAVIDEKAYAIPGKTILVEQVLPALQALAKYHRNQFTIPFIAITGSNGKTSTKELVHAVISTTYKTYTTAGNLNNHIGIPLTLLKIKQDAAMAIVEMGANHQKEIAGYCTYTLPTHGLITNCGKAHLEGFGGVEGVRKGKGELYDFLREHGGTAFMMSDYDYLEQMGRGIQHIIRYGAHSGDFQGEVIASDPFIQVRMTKGADTGLIKTQIVGDYNLPNILAAVTIGKYFKVPDDKIRTAIESYIPSNSRSQLLETGSNKIILDAYNANPSSMQLAIENFAKTQAENKILILGAMAELGDESLAEHQKMVNLIGQYQWKHVLLVGGDFLKIQHPYLSFSNAEEARQWMQKTRPEHAYMLVKGSRSMKMEDVLKDN